MVGDGLQLEKEDDGVYEKRLDQVKKVEGPCEDAYEGSK